METTAIPLPNQNAADAIKTVVSQNLRITPRGIAPAHPLYSVKDEVTSPERTTARYENGLSRSECVRLANAGWLMWKIAHDCKRTIFYVSIGDALLDLNESNAMQEIQKLYTRLVKEQSRRKIPQAWILTLETKPSLHGHMILIADQRIMKILKKAFGKYLRGDKAIEIVTTWERFEGLTRGYLTKERTVQANYGQVYRHPRVPGSHKLAIGGDRVRLSAFLEREGIARGIIQPWKKTNSRLALTRKPRTKLPGQEIREIGQGELFKELASPAARLKDHTAGTLSPSARMEIETRRRRRRITQRELGRRAGLSQPQIANAVNGRFGLSRAATERLKAVLMA